MPATSNSTEYVAKLRSGLESAYKCVRDQMGHALDRQKDIYDRKVYGNHLTLETGYGFIVQEYQGASPRHCTDPGVALLGL